MSKLMKITTNDGGDGWVFYCPGCKCYHSVQTVKGPNYAGAPIWEWDGNEDAPTFSPSVLVRATNPERCHLFVRAGMIEYLNDSGHELRGQTVAMQEA